MVQFSYSNSSFVFNGMNKGLHYSPIRKVNLKTPERGSDKLWVITLELSNVKKWTLLCLPIWSKRRVGCTSELSVLYTKMATERLVYGDLFKAWFFKRTIAIFCFLYTHGDRWHDPVALDNRKCRYSL